MYPDDCIVLIDSRARVLWASYFFEGINPNDVIGNKLWDWGHQHEGHAAFYRAWIEGEVARYRSVYNLVGKTYRAVITMRPVDAGTVSVISRCQWMLWPFETLTERETAVMLNVFKGMTAAENAEALHISQNTIPPTIHRAKEKLDVHNGDVAKCLNQLSIWAAAPDYERPDY